MALVDCPECGAEISDQASACPHCGHPRQPLAPPSAPKRQGIRWWARILILALFGWCVVAIRNNADQASTNDSRDETDAYVTCRKFLEERLRAPSTAKYPFGMADEHTTFEGVGVAGPRYRVKSYVDAQNGFGAQIRSDFECVVEYAGKGNWQLQSLTINGQ